MLVHDVTISQREFCVVGDSHSLKYRNRLLQTEKGLIRSLDGYYRGFSLNTCFSILNSTTFLFILQRAGLVGSTGRAWHLELSKYINEHRSTGSRLVYPPCIVLFAGEIDIRTALKERAPDLKESAALIGDLISKYVTLVSLFRNSFKVTPFVHLLDPPTADTRLFNSVNEKLVDLEQMGMIYSSFNNRLISEFGRDAVIDYGRNVAMPRSGNDPSFNLHPYFEGDGCHASPRVVPLAVRELLKKRDFLSPIQ